MMQVWHYPIMPSFFTNVAQSKETKADGLQEEEEEEGLCGPKLVNLRKDRP